MDKSLVCRVLVPRNNDEPSVSTGYAVKKGIVMLSRHALTTNDRNYNQPVILSWETNQNVKEKSDVDKEHYTDDPNDDLAFIECETPPDTPASLNFLANRDFPQGMQWETYGYPISQRVDKEINYEPTTVGGTTTSSNPNGKIELDSTTEMNPPSLWAGISGAPIFFGVFLAGIIIEKLDAHIKRLEGISLPYLIDKYPEISELLKIPNENEKFLNKALDIIKTKEMFNILKTLDSKSHDNEEQIYITLTTRSIGSFLELIVSFQNEFPADKEQLSNLAFALLPHFIDDVVASNLRSRLESDVINVPYANAQPIEALMAKLDRRALAIDVATNNIFIATYAIPSAPESGDNKEAKTNDLTDGLFKDCGGDLLQIPRVQGQTNFLFKRIGTAGLTRELENIQKVEFINSCLGRDKKRNKPRYYMLCQHKDFEDKDMAQNYYQEFKKLYPHCVVITPSDDFKQILQDAGDYEILSSVFSPKSANKDH